MAVGSGLLQWHIVGANFALIALGVCRPGARPLLQDQRGGPGVTPPVTLVSPAIAARNCGSTASLGIRPRCASAARAWRSRRRPSRLRGLGATEQIATSVLRDEQEIEAHPHAVGHLQEKLLRWLDPEVAHLEFALASHPECVVPPPHASRKGHGTLHAADEHAPADREQHIGTIRHGREGGLYVPQREADLRVALHREGLPHVAVAPLYASPECRGADSEDARHTLTEIGLIGAELAPKIARSTREVAERERGVEGDLAFARDCHPALGLSAGGSRDERQDRGDHKRAREASADLRVETGPTSRRRGARRGEG